MCSQAGLPARLRTIVDLEALLNDGSAYVLFFLLRVSLSWVPGHQHVWQLLFARGLAKVAESIKRGEYVCLAGIRSESCLIVSVPEAAWGC